MSRWQSKLLSFANSTFVSSDTKVLSDTLTCLLFATTWLELLGGGKDASVSDPPEMVQVQVMKIYSHITFQ